MSHNYHPHCGCAQCDRIEEADEAREEWISDHVSEAADKLMRRDSFAEGVLNDLNDAALAAFATDLGTFFERYHAGNTDAELAQAGYSLYRTLLPYIETAADEHARTDVAAEYDADMARMERDAA